MPQKDTIDVTPGAWVEITSADATAISFQVVGGAGVYVQGAVGEVAPADRQGAFLFRPVDGLISQSLADLFPGVAGATRVFVTADNASAVAVQHA